MQTTRHRLGQISRQTSHSGASLPVSRSMSTSTVLPAPWRPLFQTHISKLASPEFVLSTVHHNAASGTSLPRARYCIHRGFFAELPENKHNDAERNPAVYESDLLTFTTDVRMDKVGDLRGGAGGDVEAVFWVKDTMSQWRIKGQAYILGANAEEDVAEKKGRAEIEKWLRKGKEAGKKEEWSWEREVTAHFGNLSPGMRGSFKNPPPGTPVSETLSNPDLKLGQKVTSLDDPVARKNFRLAVIRPTEVEQVDLTDPAEARRWRWTFVGSENSEKGVGDWEKVELWP